MTEIDVISNELDHIERQNGVRILYACEAGSRAWGFASPDSDFDVRFVYVRPLGDYLRLDEQRDVIEWSISAENIGLEADFDSSGWDLPKFLRLMRASNPSAFEWLHSPIVYRQCSDWQLVTNASDKCFNPKSVGYHYIGMAQKHDLRYLKSDFIRPKKYAYVIRAILAARWVNRRFSPVPVPFDELKDAMLEPDMTEIVDELLEIKRSCGENEQIGHISELDEWIYPSLAEVKEATGGLRSHEKCGWGSLTDIFRHFLGI